MELVGGRTLKRVENRQGTRQAVAVPARIVWKDSRGSPRIASVMTRDVSETGVYIEGDLPFAIPMYRLVDFQIERQALECEQLPAALRAGRVLSAVYRLGPYRQSSGTPQGYALRLLIEPRKERPARQIAAEASLNAVAIA